MEISVSLDWPRYIRREGNGGKQTLDTSICFSFAKQNVGDTMGATLGLLPSAEHHYVKETP